MKNEPLVRQKHIKKKKKRKKKKTICEDDMFSFLSMISKGHYRTMFEES
jgi:hypothetical protein